MSNASTRGADDRFRDLFDAVPAAIYTTDAEGTITFANRAAVELAGREPEIGKDKWCVVWRLYRPDGTPLAHEDCPLAVTLRERRPVRGVEAVAERPDGTRIPFIPFPTPLFDASGALTGAVNLLVDITARKEADAARRAEQAAAMQLASIVASSGDAIVSKDLNGIVVSWNQGAERLFGYSAAEMIGRSVTILIPTDAQAEEERILERIRSGHIVEHRDTIRRHKDGRLLNVSLMISPVKDPQGRIVGASKIARDITDRKQAEKALAEHAREQAALHQFTDALYRAEKLSDVYDSAIEAIGNALRCERASILRFDEAGVMRFVAWRGLSDGYRRAVDGHSPWTADVRDPQPIFIDDIETSDIPEDLKATIRSERIGAAAFIPLVANGRLVGKFMAYYVTPHAFTIAERDLAITVARQLGFSLERRKVEEQRNLLIAELNHRVKNTLATVIAISHQSFQRGRTPEEARRSFEHRIRALAQTHGRLAEANWSGVSLETILRDETAPYESDGGNIRLSGPTITLNPKSAVSLGMAFHELATNAAKYGALSAKDGTVEVNWAPHGLSEMQIRWRESGGPPVAPPGHSGFGRLLLERALSSDLHGNVRLDFDQSGLQCAITFPLEHALGRAV